VWSERRPQPLCSIFSPNRKSELTTGLVCNISVDFLRFPSLFLMNDVVSCSVVSLRLVSCLTIKSFCFSTFNRVFTHSLKLGVISVPKIGI